MNMKENINDLEESDFGKKNSCQLLIFRYHSCQVKNISCSVTIRKDI